MQSICTNFEFDQSLTTSLAKQVMTEQLSNGWDRLTKQAQLVCEELDLEGLFNHDVTKTQFKFSVKKA